jgi:hypothetical protein
MVPAHLITELRQHMGRFRPVPAADHASPATFVHSDLKKCTYVFLSGHNTPSFGAPLQLPLQGPVMGDKMLQLLMHGRPITMSGERVKPAYILK